MIDGNPLTIVTSLTILKDASNKFKKNKNIITNMYFKYHIIRKRIFALLTGERREEDKSIFTVGFRRARSCSLNRKVVDFVPYIQFRWYLMFYSKLLIMDHFKFMGSPFMDTLLI
jgi:hypothetical protein